jgi:hypothetical protein
VALIRRQNHVLEVLALVVGLHVPNTFDRARYALDDCSVIGSVSIAECAHVSGRQCFCYHVLLILILGSFT